MRRVTRYAALGTVLIAAAVSLWVGREDGPAAMQRELPRPSPAPAVAPAQANAEASATVARPAATSATSPAATTPSAPATTPSAPVAAPPAAVAAPAAATATPPVAGALPGASTPAASFDLVRINPQGNAVIAGRAVPNAEVVALDGTTVIGRATADKRGEWVIVPEAALPPGPHTLRLNAPMTSNQPTAAPSDEVSITVPAPGGRTVAALPAIETPVSGAMPPRPVAAEGRPASIEVARIAPAQDKVMEEKLAQEQAARDKNLIVQPGNSLWRIARQSYGSGGHYAIIYSANRDRIGNPDLIYPGQIFTLPAAN